MDWHEPLVNAIGTALGEDDLSSQYDGYVHIMHYDRGRFHGLSRMATAREKLNHGSVVHLTIGAGPSPADMVEVD